MPALEAQLVGPADGREAIGHAELAEDALRVGSDRVERDDQLGGDLRTGELGPEQPEDVELPRTQRVDEPRV